MVREHHILSLSGGKDSAALALYIKENMPDIFEKLEFVFCDTECELPELYDYLNKIELFLGKSIKRLKPPVSFDHIYQTRNILPSAMNRWCTVELKTKTMQGMIQEKLKDNKDDIIYLYIGIRFDESHRVRTATSKIPNIKEQFPFVKAGLIKKDIIDILENSGIGLPKYMDWKSRSGCYFCFYQSKLEWLGLYEHHPELYKKAMEYEFNNCNKIKTKRFGWRSDISLKDLILPENIKKIKEKYQTAKPKKETTTKLFDMFQNIKINY